MNDYSPQMTGEMFSQSSTQPQTSFPFNSHAAPSLPRPKRHSDYIAMQMDSRMIAFVQSHIPRVFETDGSAIIPHCWDEGVFEPPAGSTSISILGDAHNFDGLQVLMLSVNGKTTRKDGTPYHAIWSYTPHDYRDNLREDASYQWPSRELLDNPRIKDGGLSLWFNYKDTWHTSSRVMTELEYGAEQLAHSCASSVLNPTPFSCSQFEYYPKPLQLRFSSPHFRPVCRVGYETGAAMRQDVEWGPGF